MTTERFSGRPVDSGPPSTYPNFAVGPSPVGRVGADDVPMRFSRLSALDRTPLLMRPPPCSPPDGRRPLAPTRRILYRTFVRVVGASADGGWHAPRGRYGASLADRAMRSGIGQPSPPADQSGGSRRAAGAGHGQHCWVRDPPN